MGLSFLTPLFLAGLLAISVPVIVHLIRRHQGKSLDFPSLMFLRQLPVRSVKRLRVRDWPLLLLRAAALALIVLAFSRPVLQIGANDGGSAGDGLREVVIVLDRSWSMMRGDRWDRAVSEARAVLNSLVNPDRAALVVFDGTGRLIVEPTLEPGRIRAVLDTLGPGWGGTQVGAGLQAASGILEASERSRREVVLVSDFQLRGWEAGLQDQLPRGTRVIPVDVGDDGLGSLIVSDITLEHSFFEGRQRVHPQVRIVRRGERAPTRATLSLDMDGRAVESRTVELATEGALAVAFEPITLPEDGVRASIRLVPEGGRAEEPFRFFFSAQQVLSILLVEGSGSGSSGPYLRSALSIGGGQPARVQTRAGGNVSAADLQGVDLVVFNDVPLPSGASGGVLREFVRQGGGLIVATGPASAPAGWEDAWQALLPGRVGAPVDRNPARGGSLTGIERDHPVFVPFTGLAGSGLSAPRFYRYRAIELAQATSSGDAAGSTNGDPTAPQVLASFDDGAPALTERSLGSGSGHVLVWLSSLDTSWNDLPLSPVFLPVVREMARYAASRSEAAAYFTVGQPLDVRYLLQESGVRAEGAPGSASAPAASAILVGPDGVGVELGADGAGLVHLPVPGFYEVRLGDDGSGGRRTFAANPDVAEADPMRIDPAEFIVAVAPGSGGTESAGDGRTLVDGVALDGPGPSIVLQENERRQGAWRFLLLGALLLLVSEALVAARSRPLTRTG